MRWYRGSAAVAAAFIALPVLADENIDASMRKLAADRRCVICHSVESEKTGAGAGRPLGPAWQDVARKYAGDPDARRKLVNTVLHGSSPFNSHWEGKISGYAMPPNSLDITEAEANKLVVWILALPH